jgi:hypothetical protein
MAAKNPISNLVDAILDNRGQGRGNMGMGMGMAGGPGQMAQMERGVVNHYTLFQHLSFTLFAQPSQKGRPWQEAVE